MEKRARFKSIKGLVIYKNYLQKGFSEIKDYVDETKDLINSKQKELEHYLSKEFEKNPHPDDQQEIVEFYIDDILKYDQTYIELLLNSTFITAFSLFESSFSRICKYAQLEKDAKLSVNDLNGQGIIVKCKKYIEKVIEIDLSNLDNEWHELKNLSKIRNLIVHNSSNFRKDLTKPIEQQEMYKFIIAHSSSIQMKTVGKGNFYIHNYKFVIDFCNKAESFLNEIIILILKK